MSGGDNPWPGSKDLYEMIQRFELKLTGLEQRLTENTYEQIKTQGKIDRYNGLLEKFEQHDKAIRACENKISLIEADEQTKAEHIKSIKDWVRFGITVITALIAWGVLG